MEEGIKQALVRSYLYHPDMLTPPQDLLSPVLVLGFSSPVRYPSQIGFLPTIDIFEPQVSLVLTHEILPPWPPLVDPALVSPSPSAGPLRRSCSAAPRPQPRPHLCSAVRRSAQ
jgi:hypothetical protein